MLEDVLASEAPVTPAEVTHLIKSLEVERSRYRILFGEFTCATFLSAVPYSFQELAVIPRPVLPEVFENVREWGLWHRDLQQIVAHRDLLCVRFVCDDFRSRTYHAVVGSRFTAEVKWLFANPLIDHTVGEHGLRGDAEDECAEACVAVRLALLPHCYIDC